MSKWEMILLGTSVFLLILYIASKLKKSKSLKETIIDVKDDISSALNITKEIFVSTNEIGLSKALINAIKQFMLIAEKKSI